ncbi:uncharacterized protein LOC134183890 isoform X1 [Corticium candelabrum]|uniref:uncharacterized protein LOC134183890 isoform X1 n=1 Tax=Corticium candelabrum TaxID=121492 RepID=UPI002E312B1E|nr:uncharacterized protein LOC134183890 isoform X1 [Corticium candelabrum]XP_062507442.1 uncharacterized protein LOC134183890 isoform X1 [Corticium candelabrum]XP_062507443.1 uncharacterized protein LOC134183890 isoform X1 [Corticium candelabrum]XP_062507444.1 uncharacterized protein LOC134183890 isoform X1 [Corticium candelabrum]XP_062507445.1 uncharacterized protein LOC134183890 isoform X1 [Corticium candelabrum]XP_062507446.1 uncharacterized protein LOC134183890 isoform X1 [Corticium candel
MTHKSWRVGMVLQATQWISISLHYYTRAVYFTVELSCLLRLLQYKLIPTHKPLILTTATSYSLTTSLPPVTLDLALAHFVYCSNNCSDIFMNHLAAINNELHDLNNSLVRLYDELELILGSQRLVVRAIDGVLSFNSSVMALEERTRCSHIHELVHSCEGQSLWEGNFRLCLASAYLQWHVVVSHLVLSVFLFLFVYDEQICGENLMTDPIEMVVVFRQI